MGRCEKQISQEKKSFGEIKNLVSCWYISCGDHSDLPNCLCNKLGFALAFNIYLRRTIFKKSKSMLHKNVQENVDLGGGGAKEKAAQICYYDLNNLLPLSVWTTQGHSSTERISNFTALWGIHWTKESEKFLQNSVEPWRNQSINKCRCYIHRFYRKLNL